MPTCSTYLCATIATRPLIVHAAAQQPFASSVPYDDGLFTPFENLHALSVSEYTTLRHPQFPAHSVRIKESRFCDGEVRSYTGYIDVEARHLFFYFFESRRSPEKDDVVFWTNGGPGGSSSIGLFMELGPCRVVGPNATERFEHAWNQNANVFFIDQPIGVGFSYADYGEKVVDTFGAAQDVAAFAAIFFEHFSQFRGRPFHMAGESYSGRYIPMFAAAIYDQNAQLIEAGMSPVNLSSVMIGNGCTDFTNMVTSYYEVQCQGYGFPAITSIADCVRMKQLVPRCQKKVQQSCKDVMDHIDCAAAWNFCWDAFTQLFSTLTEVNMYDTSHPCTENPDIDACYPIAADIATYLNNPSTQAALGVDPRHAANFSHSNGEIFKQFETGGDFWNFRAEHYLEALLERGVRVLIYVGENDWVCNWVGNNRMTLDLEWTSQAKFRSQPLREWFVQGELAGKTRNFGDLTFATILGAGHLAPYDHPVRSLALANRWLAGEEL
ncbi:serine carboxypeptidase [Earliella scabrosa]|nr:serine carboxypeptidase [Earliella scabrosa]